MLVVRLAAMPLKELLGPIATGAGRSDDQTHRKRSLTTLAFTGQGPYARIGGVPEGMPGLRHVRRLVRPGAAK